VLPALFLLVSRNQEDRVVVGFTKWRARESFICISVCGVQVIYNLFSPLVAHLWKFGDGNLVELI
jgi:hypothetical protein